MHARARIQTYKHRVWSQVSTRQHTRNHVIAGIHSLAMRGTQTRTVKHTSLADTHRHTVIYIRLHLRVPPWHQIALNAGSPLAGCVKCSDQTG